MGSIVRSRKAVSYPSVPREVPRWIIEEDQSDYEAWTQRIRAWAKKTLKVKGSERSPR